MFPEFYHISLHFKPYCFSKICEKLIKILLSIIRNISFTNPVHERSGIFCQIVQYIVIESYRNLRSTWLIADEVSTEKALVNDKWSKYDFIELGEIFSIFYILYRLNRKVSTSFYVIKLFFMEKILNLSIFKVGYTGCVSESNRENIHGFFYEKWKENIVFFPAGLYRFFPIIQSEEYTKFSFNRGALLSFLKSFFYNAVISDNTFSPVKVFPNMVIWFS